MSIPHVIPSDPRFIDFTDRDFKHWHVQHYAGKHGSTHHLWQCVCRCGTHRLVSGKNLANGDSTSCGCSRLKQPMHKSPEYRIWIDMCYRCLNPKSKAWKHYGGRGITVCRRWLGPAGFANFYADMGPRPPGLTLGRVKNQFGYSPDNCEWQTWLEQAQNTRTTRLITHDGCTLSVSAWVRKLGVSGPTLHRRLNRYPLAVALRPGKLPYSNSAAMVTLLASLPA